MKKTGIYKLLYSKGFIKEEDYMLLKNSTKPDAIKNLIVLGYDRNELLEKLVFGTRTSFIEPDNIHPDSSLSKLIPEKLARDNQFIPAFADDQKITIVLADPTNIEAAQQVEFITGRKVKVLFSTYSAVMRLLDEMYDPIKTLTAINAQTFDSGLSDEIFVTTTDFSDESAENLDTGFELKPVVQMVNTIFADAISHGASDIHIEPLENNVEIRYRLDGDLNKILQLPK